MPIIVILLLIALLVFGIASGMQSYATARQAQATIEVAQLGQMAAASSIMQSVTIMLLILVLVALIAAALWVLYRRSMSKRSTALAPRAATQPNTKELSPLELLLQIETMRMLKDLHGSNQLTLSDGQDVQQPENDPLHWLRKGM